MKKSNSFFSKEDFCEMLADNRDKVFYCKFIFVIIIGQWISTFEYPSGLIFLGLGYLPCAIGYLVYHAILTAHWKINNKK